MQLGIVGLGLIGGSLAAAAKQRHGATVVAVDRAAVLDHPRAAVLADERVPIERPDWAERLAHLDLIVLAVPVRAIEQLLETTLAAGPTVTDCGSTKRQIARVAATAAGASHFVPGHPMAGAPEGGLANARDDLFDGRRWILCPESADPLRVRRVTELAAGVGAQVVEMTAVEHDRAVALTSHVPQLLSSALAVLGNRRSALTGVGPAFLSAVARAGGSESMWRDIFATNHDEVAAALWDLAQELEAIAEGLDRPGPDLEPALQLLRRARSGRSDS
jgi:prephenate dehydrogenase